MSYGMLLCPGHMIKLHLHLNSLLMLEKGFHGVRVGNPNNFEKPDVRSPKKYEFCVREPSTLIIVDCSYNISKNFHVSSLEAQGWTKTNKALTVTHS